MDLLELMESRGAVLERKGSSWWCSCPAHVDDTPSLQVSAKGAGHVWYCFSCRRGGGPVAFLEMVNKTSRYAARKEWDRLNGKVRAAEGRDALTDFVESLPDARKQMEARGLQWEAAEAFGVRFCDDYQARLQAFGLDPAEARRLGLFDMSGCTVYPFYDDDGIYKVAARSVAEKRYETTPKGAAFHREGLWGVHLLKGKEAWLFEGYHDAIAARSAGYQAVAACGTEVSPAGWKELSSRGIVKVTVVPDGDLGGRAWLTRLAAEAPRDLWVDFSVLDSGDPDDLLSAGGRLPAPITPFEWVASKEDWSTAAAAAWSLEKVRPAWLRMPRAQRSLAKDWFAKDRVGADALEYLVDDVKPDWQSERTVLANAMVSPNARLEAVRDLHDWHFHGRENANVWNLVRSREATLQMASAELGVDLSRDVDLMNYRYYIERIKDSGSREKVAKVLATADPADVSGIVRDLYGVVEHARVAEASDLAAAALERVNQRCKSPGMPGTPLRNFPALNRMLLGLVPGRYVLLSGNSGHGKTTLACNWIEELIDEHETLFVSMEMTEDDVMDKIVAIRSGVPHVKCVTGSLDQNEYDAVMDAAGTISRSKLSVLCGVFDLFKLVAMVKARAMKGNLRFVFIDYLQMMMDEGAREDERWEQLAQISQALKNQLCPMGVTVVALSQLTKAALNSDAPDAANQAGAYAILAPADHAITVRKVDPKEAKDGSNLAIHLSKNRFGLDSVVIPSTLDRATQRIREV